MKYCFPSPHYYSNLRFLSYRNLPYKNFLFLIFFFTTVSYSVIAQNIVRGTVAVGDSALQGVSVRVKGAGTGTQTDVSGHYSITAPPNATLAFSSVGFESQEVKVNNRSVINVQLISSSNQLGDVVVIGYGTQRRKDIAGSVASIPAEKLAERPVSTFDQALQGLAPGLQIAQRNASPGELSTINLRGIGSLSAGFEPLFVVDGFPTDQRNATAINPMDIQSIEILKDAASTAIYGSRGANGVIIITTKSGTKGKALVDVNISGGIAKVNKKDLYDPASGAEYVQYYKEYYTNLGLPIPMP